jgi:hypothetical protein
VHCTGLHHNHFFYEEKGQRKCMIQTLKGTSKFQVPSCKTRFAGSFLASRGCLLTLVVIVVTIIASVFKEFVVLYMEEQVEM